MIDLNWKVSVGTMLLASTIGVASQDNATEPNIDGKVKHVVSQASVSDWKNEAEEIPAPEPVKDDSFKLVSDLVAEQIGSNQCVCDCSCDCPSADEFREMIGECGCDCDCPTKDEIREVMREELARALKAEMLSLKSPPANASTGGSVSNGSTGGSVSRDYGKSIVMHSLARGRCPACEAWMANEAPRYRAMGYAVGEVKDVTSGYAPRFDVCNGNVCEIGVSLARISSVAR